MNSLVIHQSPQSSSNLNLIYINPLQKIRSFVTLTLTVAYPGAQNISHGLFQDLARRF
jgi:hypothetical protein